jgi:hypothetical protein
MVLLGKRRRGCRGGCFRRIGHGQADAGEAVGLAFEKAHDGRGGGCGDAGEEGGNLAVCVAEEGDGPAGRAAATEGEEGGMELAKHVVVEHAARAAVGDLGGGKLLSLQLQQAATLRRPRFALQWAHLIGDGWPEAADGE